LIRSQLELEGILEFTLPRRIGRKSETPGRLPDSGETQQLRCHLTDRLLDSRLASPPAAATQPIEIGPDISLAGSVLLDQIRAFNWHQ